MSLKTDLRTLLIAQSAITDTLAGTSAVYVGNAGQGQALPHIVLTTTTTDFLTHLGTTAGLKFEDIDIDCKAATQVEANATAAAVKTFIDDYTGSTTSFTIRAVVMQGQTDDYVPDGEGKNTGVFYETLDVNFQYE